MRSLFGNVLAYVVASLVASLVVCLALGAPSFFVYATLITLVLAFIPTAILVALLQANRGSALLYGPAGVLAAGVAALMTGLVTSGTWLLVPIGVAGFIGGYTYVAVYLACTTEVSAEEGDSEQETTLGEHAPGAS